MAIPDSFLDELREKLPVSAVVGRKHPLIKRGVELVAKDDPSISVNDHKRLWYDFGKRDDGGDIFQWMMEVEGFEFPQAVEECAKIAGIPMPKNGAGSSATPKANSSVPDDGAPPWHDEVPPLEPDQRGAIAARREPAKITKVYDYTDQQGALLYQVCRLEWDEDGKHKKTFFQRRPTADGESWIRGLGAGDYLKGRNGEWLKLTKDREKWVGAERRMFTDSVEHGLYRLIEFKELASRDEPVWLTEGEKDTDTLWDWGFVATTNSGGAGNFRSDHAEMFRGLDVVLAIDNDDAGRKRANTIGPMLRGIARSVRVFDVTQVWPGAGKGKDVTDWKTEREGDRDELIALMPKLPEWKPAPFVSKLGRVSWADQDRPHAATYSWWVKGLIPSGETIAVIGAMSCGKSFETFNLGGHIATGRNYRGHRTRQGLVVFCAPEGGSGTVNRMKAYRQEHGLPLDGIPFEALTKRFNLFASDADVAGLIGEIKAISAEWKGRFDLALVIIDTWSAATSGMDENSAKDASTVRSRIIRIQQECGCSVLFVHHTNASGERQRGHSSITADVDSVFQVQMVTRQDGKLQIPVKDDSGRPIRRITNFKQKEAKAGQHWDFVIREVELYRDADGDPVTSCVTSGPSFDRGDGVGEIGGNPPRDMSIRLTYQRSVILEALRNALSEHGEDTPTKLKLPRAIKTVVRVKNWKAAYLTKVSDEQPPDNADAETIKTFQAKINKRLGDASDQFQSLRLIGRDNPYVWLTSRAAGPIKVEPVVHEGEPVGDLLDDLPTN